VRARGKRTQLTSVSLDPQKINDFGPALYRALRPDIDGDGHSIIEHSELLQHLRVSAELNADLVSARLFTRCQYMNLGVSHNICS
jgi:hypothetical protein